MPKYNYEPQQRALKNYRSKKDQINITLDKEVKEQLMKAAQRHGMSLSQYILSRCLGKTEDPPH